MASCSIHCIAAGNWTVPVTQWRMRMVEGENVEAIKKKMESIDASDQSTIAKPWENNIFFFAKPTTMTTNWASFRSVRLLFCIFQWPFFGSLLFRAVRFKFITTVKLTTIFIAPIWLSTSVSRFTRTSLCVCVGACESTRSVSTNGRQDYGLGTRMAGCDRMHRGEVGSVMRYFWHRSIKFDKYSPSLASVRRHFVYAFHGFTIIRPYPKSHFRRLSINLHTKGHCI